MATPLQHVRSRIEAALGANCGSVCKAIRSAGNESPNLRITRDGLAAIIQKQGVSLSTSLLDEAWNLVSSKTEEGAFSRDILVLFAPFKVAQYLNKLNKKAVATRHAQKKALECKQYDRSAQLEQHTLSVLNEAESIKLDADPLDTVHKAKERELIKQVKTATTTLMKQNAENALNLYRELMEIGHSPSPTPRGSRMVVKDYDRPMTADEFGDNNNSMLIDLLPPDQHQAWRGTVRSGLMGVWRDKHNAMKHKFQLAETKCMEQRLRAEHNAFSKAPYVSQSGSTSCSTKTQHAHSSSRLKTASPASRPRTSCAALAPTNRPGTSTGKSPLRPLSRSSAPPPPPEASNLLRLVGLALQEADVTLSRALADAGVQEGAPLTKSLLDSFLGHMSIARDSASVDSLYRYVTSSVGGGVGVSGWAKALDAAVVAAEVGPEDTVMWVHPRRGMMLLGKRQAAVLSELQGRVKQRWKSHAQEAFSCIAMGGVGHMIGRGELRGILSGLCMHASTQDFEELWAVFCERPGEQGDKAGNSSGAPWADVRAILGVDDAERRLVEREAEAVKRREEIKTRKHTSPKKKGGQPLRDARADPWESMTDEEKIAELMMTTYRRGIGGGKPCDHYAMNAPLFHKSSEPGLSPSKTIKAARMRPISQAGSRPASVDLGRSTRIRWADSSPAARSSTPDGLVASRDHEGQGLATLQPFSAVGSDLKMTWRRWNGGKTVGPQKSSAQDPAAPGETACLMPGAGEFTKTWSDRLQGAENLKKILADNPDIEWNSMKSTYRLPQGFLDRERGRTAGGDGIEFPTGMQAGTGSSRPASRLGAAEEGTLSGAGTARGPAGYQIPPANSQGFLKKERYDNGDAKLVGTGTYWRDVGPPWKATSKDIGSLVPPAPERKLDVDEDWDSKKWAEFGLGRVNLG